MDDLARALLAGKRQHPFEAAEVDVPGIYAWWATSTLPWPGDFPYVDHTLPLYVGIAESETLSERIVGCHLSRTRGSALRRSLSALLLDDLNLGPHIVPGTAKRRSKFGMTSDGEALLTEWMLANLEVSWVAVDNPGPLERTVVGTLLPPLNDALATGSPFRALHN